MNPTTDLIDVKGDHHAFNLDALGISTDQYIYVQTVIDQINNGMYAHLFEGKKDLVFLDIGANIGLISIYAVPFCKRIVALEPSPEVFPVLRQMTKDHSIIGCADIALAPTDGDSHFFVNDINSTASSTVNTYGNMITIHGLTLASILNEFELDHVDVCKCDCEGCEGESLTYDQLSCAKD